MNRTWLLVALLALAAPLSLLAEDDQMNLVKLHVNRFTVVGFEVRTSNAQEMNGSGAIARLWRRLGSEHYESEIPHRVDSRVVAVYSDYESDKDGPYTYLLGAKVSSSKDVPADMVSRNVLAGTYAKFTAEGIVPAELVVSLWRRIWALEKPDQLHRAYKTDYEVYDAAPAKAHVSVFLGVQNKR